MQLKCKVCKRQFPIAANHRLAALCKSCTEERSHYLGSMEASFPLLGTGLLKDGAQDSLILERLPPSSDTKIYCYQKVNVPGKNTCVIGKGTYGEVWLMEHRKTKETFAMKVIPKQDLGSVSKKNTLQQEIDIQQRIVHENVIKVYDVMSDRENIYLLMEYAAGGNLFRYIRKRKLLTEREAYKFFKQIASAVNFLHKNSLLHRDIKPENILIAEDGTIKLCDFGCCTFCDELEGMKSFCGTVEYMAPEVLGHKYYNSNADIWSLGILLYEMLHGHSPFKGNSVHETAANIRKNEVMIEEHVKEDAREVISVILNLDPEERPKVCEILDSAWARRLEEELSQPEIISERSVEERANTPQSRESKGRKSVTESGTAELMSCSPETATTEKEMIEETEELPKKVMDVINTSIVKIVRVPRDNRNRGRCNLHRKLARGMFLSRTMTQL